MELDRIGRLAPVTVITNPSLLLAVSEVILFTIIPVEFDGELFTGIVTVCGEHPVPPLTPPTLDVPVVPVPLVLVVLVDPVAAGLSKGLSYVPEAVPAGGIKGNHPFCIDVVNPAPPTVTNAIPAFVSGSLVAPVHPEG